MYWIWANERSDEYELRIDGVPPIIDENDWDFDFGQHIIDTVPVIDVPFTMQPDERMTDNLIAPGCRGLLINRKVRKIFNDTRVDNIQYFQTRLVNSISGEIGEDYMIANIVGKIDCLDYEKSELELDRNGNIKFIDRLSIKNEETIDYGNVFRLSAFHPIVVVSTLIKEEMKKHQITGIKFYRPEDYSL